MTVLLARPVPAVENFDQCTGDECTHCKAGRPAAPEDWDPRIPEALWELDDDVRAALPPAFHLPVFIDTCTPKGWFCACCWDAGTLTMWPCQVASKHGNYVHRELVHDRAAARRG